MTRTPSHLPHGRLFVCVLVFALVFGVLAARLVQLQYLEHERFASRAARQHLRPIRVPAQRGMIFDCRGRLLATTLPAVSVFVDPLEVQDVAAAAKLLSHTLHIDEVQVRPASGSDGADGS